MYNTNHIALSESIAASNGEVKRGVRRVARRGRRGSAAVSRFGRSRGDWSRWGDAPVQCGTPPRMTSA